MMNEKISLIKNATGQSSLKLAAQNGTATVVWAEKQSVKRAEFYQAFAADLHPEAVFLVWTEEYDAHQSVLYGTDYYKVRRSFDRPDSRTELVCERL